MITKTSVLFLVLTITLSGCMSIAWIGYDKPDAHDYQSIDGVPIKIGMQNLKKEVHEQAIREAMKEVFSILESDEFRQKVESRDWLISCKLTNGEKDILDGKSVYQILSTGYVDFSINPRNPWSAIAQTQKSTNDHTKNRVAIEPKRISKWSADDIATKSLLVNTLAHEITHTVSFKFADRGHGTEACPDAQLVSYGIGNMVAGLWQQKRERGH